MLTVLIIILALSGVVYGLKNKSVPYTPLPHFEIERYMGLWYEIARIDHRFQRDTEHVTAEYRLLDNGSIKVTNTGYDKRTGRRRRIVGKAKATSVVGHLRVSFFPLVYADYNIIALGDDYEYALVGGSSPQYLWILARTTDLPPAAADKLVAIAREKGYDTDKLIFTGQKRM
ncbi:MAG: lipocalin family protein [Alistipes sp.]|nr:lipocalin family protein [Alistipes sp.]